MKGDDGNALHHREETAQHGTSKKWSAVVAKPDVVAYVWIMPAHRNGEDAHAEQAFLTRYRAVEGDLRAFVSMALVDWNQVEDVMQEVALVLWRKYPDYDPARPFGAWARGIARIALLQLHRRQRYRQSLLAPAVIEALAEPTSTRADEETGDADRLSHCLGLLTPAKRELVRQRFEQGLAIETLAADSGRSEAAVIKSLQRIRLALTDCMARLRRRGHG